MRTMAVPERDDWEGENEYGMIGNKEKTNERKGNEERIRYYVTVYKREGGGGRRKEKGGRRNSKRRRRKEKEEEAKEEVQ